LYEKIKNGMWVSAKTLDALARQSFFLFKIHIFPLIRYSEFTVDVAWTLSLIAHKD